MGFTSRSISKGQPDIYNQTGQDVESKQGQRQGEPGQARPFIVARATPMDNETATMPHRKDQRPDKGKLTTAKKV
ncbi:MAG: hypothetical protein ACXVJ1_09520, partial [Candidatus Angelobacter sp.]